MCKADTQVLLIRHGEGAHNATGRYNICDPFLTQVGVSQAKSLRGSPPLRDCQLLVVSPLSRAIQTAVAIFGEHPSCRVVLNPLVSERWTGSCDEGRPKSELISSFPFLASWEGFDSLPEHWSPKKGSDENWREQRVPAIRAWLKSQPEDKVVVVGHGCFFEGLSGKYLQNCEVYSMMYPEDVLERLNPSLDASVRQEAAEHLGSMNVAMLTARDEVMRLLEDKEDIVRAKAVRALGRIGKASRDLDLKRILAEKVSNMLDDASTDVVCHAAEAIGDLGDAAKSFVGLLTKHLNDPNEALRQNAAWAIGQLLRRQEPVQGSTPSCTDTICDSPASKRRRLTRKSPEKTHEMDYPQQLARLLDDNDALVQWYAVEALGHMGEVPVQSVSRIAEFLKGSDAEAIQNAAWALGQAGSIATPAAAKLVKLFNHKATDVRFYAVEALGYIGGDVAEQHAPDVLKKLQDCDADVRKAAAWTLGMFSGRMKAVPKQLVACLRDGDASVRDSAIEALGLFGVKAKAFSKDIARLANDQDSEVRKKASIVSEKLDALVAQLSPIRSKCTNGAANACTKMQVVI